MKTFPLNKLSAVLFDLDGTLIDTAPDFISVLQNMLSENGFPSLNDNDIRNCVSNGSNALIKLAFENKVAPSQLELLRQQLLEKYLIVSGCHSRLFPGMEDILELIETKNIPWGIVTNKPRKFSVDLLTKLSLINRCSVLVCPDDVIQPKPSAEPMLFAANLLKISIKNAVYIGDHERDISSGKAAGMGTIAAAYGYINNRNEIPNWQADCIINNPLELKQLFLA